MLLKVGWKVEMLLRADCRVYLLIVNYTVWATKFSLNVAQG